MAYFADSADLYKTLGGFLDHLSRSTGLGAQLAATNQTVRLALSDPDATITVALRAGAAPTFQAGDSALEPTLTLAMASDTAHDLFVGRRGMSSAVQEGLIGVQGETQTLLALWPSIAFAAAPRYSQTLEAQGRSDLAA